MLSRISLYFLPAIILIIMTVAIFKKVPIYEEFTQGAKESFPVCIKIIPYLVAIIVAISMFRASGCLDLIGKMLSPVLIKLHVSSDLLPLMIVRSLSGTGALGIFSDIANNVGPGAYATKLGAIMLGSSETTFYVLSVYFGSVGIKKFSYAIIVGLLADIVGIVAAIFICRLFF